MQYDASLFTQKTTLDDIYPGSVICNRGDFFVFSSHSMGALVFRPVGASGNNGVILQNPNDGFILEDDYVMPPLIREVYEASKCK